MAKPTLALIPASQGSKLFSVLPSSGVGDFDFSRGSAATRINSQGLIEAVASGQSRLDYPLIDGKVVGCPHHILEPARTNLLIYSNDFSNPNWIKGGASVTSDAAISPDGSLNADKLTESSSSGIHLIVDPAISTTGSVSGSIYAKYLSRYLRLTIHDSTNPNEWYSVIYDLQNGTIYDSLAKTVTVFSSEIKQMPNGYYRCIITADLGASSSTVLYVQTSNGASIVLGDDRGRGQYQGDGTSGIYIYGAQLEAGSYPTSYIPTTTTTVTRSAETANGAGDASTFNDSEGVLMAEISALANDGTYKQIGIGNGVTGNEINISYDSTANRISVVYRVGNSYPVNLFVIGNSSTELNKIVFKYKANDFAFWLNGIKQSVNTTNSTMISGLNNLKFASGSGASNFYGKTKQLQYYNSALIDSELEQLTSWISFTDMANGQLYTIE